MKIKPPDNSQCTITVGEGKYSMTINAHFCGKDASICIYGGNEPHIGAVAVAVPRKSLSGDDSDSSSASVICISGHKEDELARKAALTLSAKWQCNVTVSAGVHINSASKDDFIEIEKNFTALTDALIDWHKDKSGMLASEQIIIVDEEDREIGPIEKMAAHHNGILHRAFSILVFNSKNELLLQRRSMSKYHTPGLWTNSCCSHPRFGEKLVDAVNRRLMEEMGFTCPLEEIFSFRYKAEFEEGLYEHEFDHVFVGRYDDAVHVNPEEVEDYKWVGLEIIKTDILKNPDQYTYWFKHLIALSEDQLKRYLEMNTN